MTREKMGESQERSTKTCNDNFGQSVDMRADLARIGMKREEMTITYRAKLHSGKEDKLLRKADLSQNCGSRKWKI